MIYDSFKSIFYPCQSDHCKDIIYQRKPKQSTLAHWAATAREDLERQRYRHDHAPNWEERSYLLA
jgi:hypothetical protein